jgi:hypothetical protein
MTKHSGGFGLVSDTILYMTDHSEWLTESTGTTVHAVAIKTGVDPSNFANKVKRGLSAEEVINISYEYGLDPVQALVDTGYLHGNSQTRTDPKEVANRIRQDLAALERIATQEIEQDATVYEFPGRSDPYTDDMPEGAAAYGGELFDTDDDDDY